MTVFYRGGTRDRPEWGLKRQNQVGGGRFRAATHLSGSIVGQRPFARSTRVRAWSAVTQSPLASPATAAL